MTEFRVSRRWFAAVAVTAAVWCFAGLPFQNIISGDESRVAGIVRAMLFSGDWLMPRLNGAPFLEYPPLFYWLDAAALALFGVSEWTPALGSAFAAFFSALLLFRLARRLEFSPPLAFTSVFVMLSSSNFFFNRMECRVDMLLLASVLLADYGFAGLFFHPRFRCADLLCAAFGMAAGVMTKGLPGLLIAPASAGVFLLLSDIRRRSIGWSSYILSALAFLLALLAPAVWLFLLERRFPGSIREVLVTNGIDRFSGAQGDHTRPWWWYLAALPQFFEPWLIFALASVAVMLRGLRRSFIRRDLFLLCVLLVPFAALSCASAKRAVYLLPLTPAASLAVCRLIERLRGISSPRLKAFFLRCVRRKRVLVAAAAVAGIVFTLIEIPVLRAQSAGDSLAPLFSDCSVLRSSGRRIVLIDAAERTAGAACFYLGENVPSVPSSAAVPSEQEVWVVRRRGLQSGAAYGDRHRLLDTVDAQREFLRWAAVPAD